MSLVAAPPSSLTLDLPPALATPPGAGAVADGAGARAIGRGAAEGLFCGPTPVLVAHAGLTARRLGLEAPARAPHLLDVLELFVFVRPARFCAPTPTGLAIALGLDEPVGAVAQAEALRAVAGRLLGELMAADYPDLEAALTLNGTLTRAGWSWGERIDQALRAGLEAAGRNPRERREPGTGLDVWNRLSEWEEVAPRGEAGSHPVDSESARIRLDHMLKGLGLDEARPTQSDYAAEAAFAFSPRDHKDQPRALLAEAGTGTGKTLGYLAPAALWAERNHGTVWVSTYTRALQRQIAREGLALPDHEGQTRRRVVVRKGRENYLCLLNLQEMVQQAQLGAGDVIGLGLTARWAGACADGDMTGGDFPAWLPGLYAGPAAHQPTPANLVDRRGECIHAACAHYRRCFVEKTVRAARHADVVIANHALVMVQAAFDGARAARHPTTDSETAALKRIVFDEGHHLFEAADSAFSSSLSGQEAAELRRWIRGPETRARRGRGLEQRLGDLIGDDGPARKALGDVLAAATRLPGEGAQARILRGSESGAPTGPVEVFLAAALDQLRARADPRGGSEDQGMECAARPAIPDLIPAAARAAEALAAVEAPLLALSRHLEDVLAEEAETLDGGARARIEGALRGLDRRARMTLPSWRAMLNDLASGDGGGDFGGDPDFVDWLSAESAFGRLSDVSLRRHWVDPTQPLEATVIRPSHGVLVTSATLTDPDFGEDPFHLARLRSATGRLETPVRTLKVESPFDYAAQSKVIVVTDVPRDDPRRTAAAMRALFLASGGGALGLFTAIRRLKAVYGLLGPELGRAGLPLYAQHIDPLDVGALVDVFRTERDSCLLGTDAIRDGVDVPGRPLRLLVFDRVPWPRPDLLHRARRERFARADASGGGRTYDDALARGRMAQAFGRLIRRADDKGVFVMLDAACPTRLFGGLPPGVEVQRMELAEAVATLSRFLGPDQNRTSE